VTLVERERDFERVFRGEGLMPTGLDALYQMGLREKLNALPWRYLESWEIYLNGTQIMHIPEPSQELGELALRIVSQPKLLELLIAEARASENFTFLAPTTVRDLLWDGERVCGVRVSCPEGEREIKADLVIGADGRASVVRKRADLPLDLLPESYDILWFKLPLPRELENRCPIQIFARGPEAALGYVSWDNRFQMAWMLPKGSWGEVRKRDWLRECTHLLPDSLARHVLTNRTGIEGPRLLDVIVGRCRTWSRRGVLLLGDAAHPMSPVRAQGINMALRDAIVAANHLVPAIREGHELMAPFREIQREREREIIRLQHLQLREVRGQRWARERPWLARPLLALAPWLAKTGLVQRLWLRQQRELRFGVTEVQLRV
jgi:2-polyprenyl-6-methoxyphenol hydroxylase-like FAD-dependent oxidoreductase